MKNSQAYQLTSGPSLEVVSGNDRGRVYEMSSERLSLGRNDNNDIVIPSDAASRYHAVIERGEDGQYWVRDNQSKNGISVNGNGVLEAVLKNGDSVQVGGLIFRFHLPEAAPVEAPLAAVAEIPAAYGEVAGLSPSKATRSKRPLIYGVLALVLGGLYMVSQQPEKTADVSGNTSEASSVAGTTGKDGAKENPLVQPKLDPPAPGSKISGLEDPLGKTDEDALKAELSNNPTKEAEQYFRKGQREYLNKNYHRAIEAFRAALSLQRNHELADYYLRLALYEVETEAKRNMDIGRKYFQAMQYSRAMFHFNEAINLMQHRPTDKMVPEAERLIEQCRRRLQAAEQLP